MAEKTKVAQQVESALKDMQSRLSDLTPQLANGDVVQQHFDELAVYVRSQFGLTPPANVVGYSISLHAQLGDGAYKTIESPWQDYGLKPLCKSVGMLGEAKTVLTQLAQRLFTEHTPTPP